VKSLVEKWLQRQLAAEVFGNLAVGGLMALLSLPLMIINVVLIWFVVRLVFGGHPLEEMVGNSRFSWDISTVVAGILFLVWSALYVAWHEWREWRKHNNPAPHDDNPPIWDTGLVVLQILFAAPGAIYSALSFFNHARTWVLLDVKGCSQVLGRLLSHPRRVALDELKREFPELDWDKLLRQMHLIPGVVFLTSPPAGLSLTGEFRQTLLKHKVETEWRSFDAPPPPRDERAIFSCAGCGQRLRIRRFQKGYAIRCPRCHKRYRGYLDIQGRLRIEPEPEQKKRATPVFEQDELVIHFRVLNVAIKSDLDTVRRAYRKLMKEFHPDLYAMADAAKRAQVEEKAKQINEAYHAILDYLEGKEPKS
jgi:DNA-directed RNA polymerase subunit RPC12/RpoP